MIYLRVVRRMSSNLLKILWCNRDLTLILLPFFPSLFPPSNLSARCGEIQRESKSVVRQTSLRDSLLAFNTRWPFPSPFGKSSDIRGFATYQMYHFRKARVCVYVCVCAPKLNLVPKIEAPSHSCTCPDSPLWISLIISFSQTELYSNSIQLQSLKSVLQRSHAEKRRQPTDAHYHFKVKSIQRGRLAEEKSSRAKYHCQTLFSWWSYIM